MDGPTPIILPSSPRQEEILVAPFKWEMDENEGTLATGRGYSQFRVWTHNEQSETVLCLVQDYPTFLYYVFPEEIDEQPIEWCERDASALHELLKFRMGDNGQNLLSYSPEHYVTDNRTFYYYGLPKPMCKLYFKNSDAQRYASSILNKAITLKSRRVRVEGKVLLREIDGTRKLLTDLNTTHCSWIRCKAQRITDPNRKISNREKEYVVSHRSIRCDDTVMTVPRPKWCAFDIEQYSSNPKAFPNPYIAEDEVYLITLCFYRDGSPGPILDPNSSSASNAPKEEYPGASSGQNPLSREAWPLHNGAEPWKVYAIMKGECEIKNEVVRRLATIIRIPDQEGHDSEVELIERFCSLIIEEDPDFITGYNIQQYDNKVLFRRMDIRGLDMPGMSRLLSNPPTKVNNVRWKSDAFKNKNLWLWTVEGRCVMDFFEHTIRTYNSWSVYSLDNAGKELLPKRDDLWKLDMPPERQFAVYKAMRKACAKRDKYRRNPKYFVDRSRDAVRSSPEKDKEGIYDELFDAQVDGGTVLLPPSLSPSPVSDELDSEAFNSPELNISSPLIDMGELVAYGIYDSLLVAYLTQEINWWISIQEKSKAVGLQPEEMYVRGTQAGSESVLYHECMINKVILDKREILPYNYQGGLVQDPDVGIHDDVIVIDFNSLYPNIMKDENLCGTTLINPLERVKYAKVPQRHYRPKISYDGVTDKEGEEDETLLFDQDKKSKKKVTRMPACIAGVIYKQHDKVPDGFMISPKGDVYLLSFTPPTPIVVPTPSPTPVKSVARGRAAISGPARAGLALSTLPPSLPPPPVIPKTKAGAPPAPSITDKEGRIWLLREPELFPEGYSVDEKGRVWQETPMEFVEKTTCMGIVPMTIDKLLKARGAVKKIKPIDAVHATVLDCRQLALKVSANAMYGFFGVKKRGRRPCLEIAAVTTDIGRKSITKAKDFILGKYNQPTIQAGTEGSPNVLGGDPKLLERFPNLECKVVYGDTDSLMIRIKGVPQEEFWEFACELTNDTSAQYTGLRFELEGKYKCFFIKHKHYVKLLYKKPNYGEPSFPMITEFQLDHRGKPKKEVKGLAPTRRDNCQFIRGTLADMLDDILEGKCFFDCLYPLILGIRNLYSGEISLEDLVMTKNMGSGYKNDNAPMKMFADNMLSNYKQAVNPGERHKFLVVDNLNSKKVGQKMMLLSVYQAMSESKRSALDFNYYFVNLMLNKMDTYLGAAFFQHADHIRQVSLRWQKNRVVTAMTPGKFLLKMMDLQKTGKLVDERGQALPLMNTYIGQMAMITDA